MPLQESPSRVEIRVMGAQTPTKTVSGLKYHPAIVCERLNAFQIGHPASGLRLKLAGSDRYVSILRNAFPAGQWIGPLEQVFDPGFSHVLYVHHVDQVELERFLEFCSSSLLCSTLLDELWALDWHMGERSGERSSVGELVYQAKTYSGFHQGSAESATDLARLIAQRADAHPGIHSADLVVPVPANPRKEPHNLPDVLGREVASILNLTYADDVLTKIRPTNVKDLALEEKLEAVRGAYRVVRAVKGKSIVLVDDILRSGTTLSVIGEELRGAGASRLIGLVATKTMRD